MSPRNRCAALCGILISACFFASPVFAGENIFIKFYQDHISAVDGNRCPMYPTCSAYAAKAVKKHGPLLGTVMSLDRLVRCGRDEADVSPDYYIQGQAYIYDPVQNNDFWWFEKEKNQ